MLKLSTTSHSLLVCQAVSLGATVVINELDADIYNLHEALKFIFESYVNCG